MIRLVKRYGSRKLYDTEESRYASLEEIADWIRAGQQVRVIDNKTSEDVTVQTLGQIITEAGRRGRTIVPTEVLQELIRSGEAALSNGVEQVGRLLQASIEKVGPVRRMRDETSALRQRLEELEAALERMEAEPPVKATPKKRTRKKTARRSTKSGTTPQKR